MDDVLKQVNQGGVAAAASNDPPQPTLRRRIERMVTQLRLAQHRRTLAARLAQEEAAAIQSGQEPAAAAQSRPALGETVRETVCVPSGRKRREADFRGRHMPTGTPAAAVRETAAPAKSGSPGPAAEARRPAGSEGAPGLSLHSQVRRMGRHLHHIRHEQAAKRFPESDRTAVLFLLFLWGMVPMLGSRLRERTWGRRRQAISRFGRARAWFERKKGHPAVFLAGAGGVAVLALFFSFYTFGATVTYRGDVVARVSSVGAAQDAFENLESVTKETLGGSYTIDKSLVHYSAGLLPRKDVVDGSAFEEALSDDIGLVTYGYALYIDGELVGATPYEGALEELLQQLQDGVTDENTISSGFQEKVEIKAEYVPTDKVMNLGYLAELLYSTKTEEVTYTVQPGDTWSEIAEDHGMTSAELLAMNPGYNIDRLALGEVLTLSAAVPYLTLTVTEREHYVDEIPYEIEYTDSAYLYKGDYQVLSAGQNGKADVTANVTYVNGEETARTVLSYATLINPVTEQQAWGTKERPTWLPTGSFRWPCSGNVTSRFGYRNLSYSYASHYHEGIDIANRRGTAIYAADGGTVTYAGWMSGYGYLVRISHGNGYETYYGHNSSILVSVGQHVYKGQQVARMGSTGNSTGNHCHFGVYYNGVAKNPLNYLP